MRMAMADAAVGDDVYGEDPTINTLEREVAELFGHGAGVFVPSGTMGNLIALRLLCEPGEELLCDADAHIVSYEAGAAAAHGGIQTRTMVVDRGRLSREVVEPQVRSAGYHAVATRAIAVEQTHNRGGGAIYPLAELQRLRAMADEQGLSFHCDGARIWNAHIASGVGLAEYGELFDTMSVCLSKGLGAPVGSLVLTKDATLADKARDIRHRLGGAMRQAGVIAAGGLYAVRHHIDRLAEDHGRAKRLADGIAAVTRDVVDPDEVETNIVILDLVESKLDAAGLDQACQAEGVLVSCVAPRRVRLVTHLDVDDAGADHALDVISKALS
ncbi:MAG: aminotransferase class I/II-fold pyridoxal phosphate-dependent enzyme [Frankiaceae bacterium]|nr:aminotransferase class I/II-fold pyridoxal phosphate-dependent enzyme [Frankiaceae bacterium]MBV9872677.1 aminotransferase class I/II-fold pyridoxal phosphate-dependent enzyme [Frankiaceae bacterium]